MDTIAPTVPFVPCPIFGTGHFFDDTSTKSVLDVSVSCFANYVAANTPKPVNLLQWLKSGKYADRVAEIRTDADKKTRDAIKATLPAITPSGLFTRREKAALIEHSGLICLDIDLKGNGHIQNYADLKKQFPKLPFVAYAGLSVSGTGFFLLIPIAYPDQHESQFNELQRLFREEFGIRVDNTPDVSRLRGYSYDPDAYFNHQAKRFKGLYREPPKNAYIPTRQPAATGDTAQRVEELVRQIETHKIDITSDYADWFKIGKALAGAFGESGRDTFHRISQYYPNYDTHETDRKYTNCLRDTGRVQIATFFHICKQYGVMLPKPDHSNTIAPATEYNPGQYLPIDQSRIERLAVDTSSDYPPEWDTPTPPDAVPQIRQQPFHQWQQQHPAFSHLGIG